MTLPQSGDRVLITTEYTNKSHFNNKEGVVVNRIGRRRNIAYVRVDGLDICAPFNDSEIELVSATNSTGKEVA